MLRDVTVIGILRAPAGLDGAIEAYASGRVDPWPLVRLTVPLGGWPRSWQEIDPRPGPGPKVHVAIRASSIAAR